MWVIYRCRIDSGDQDLATRGDGAGSVRGSSPERSTNSDNRLGLISIESLAVGAFAVAMVVSAVVAAMRGWIPVSDEALIELRVRDVPSHLPLVGVWSRFGWNHPGPGLFYYLSPFYWLGGGSSGALLVAMIVLHTAFVLLAWTLVRRVNRFAGLMVLLAGVVLLVTSEPWAIRNPWNPYVAITGSLVLFAAAWSFAERRRSGAILLLPLGSFLVQVHAVMAPMVLGAGVAAMVGFLLCRKKPVPVRALIGGCFVSFVMWLPPIVEQLTNRPGNLRALLGPRGSGDALGIIPTIKVAFAQLAPWPGAISPGVVRQRYLPVGAWTLPLWVGLVVAAVFVIVRYRRRSYGIAMVCALGMISGSYAGVATLRDGPYSYLAIGTRVSVVVVLALSIAVLVDTWGHQIERAAFATVVMVIVVLSVVLGVAQVTVRDPLVTYGEVVDTFADAVVTDGPPRVVEVESTPPSLDTMMLAPGMVLELEKRGYEVRSPILGEALVGAHRARTGAHYVVKITVPGHVEDLVADGWRLLDTYEPLTESELAEVERLYLEMLDHPVDRIESIASGDRPRLERELLDVTRARPVVALVVRSTD